MNNRDKRDTHCLITSFSSQTMAFWSEYAICRCLDSNGIVVFVLREHCTIHNLREAMLKSMKKND